MYCLIIMSGVRSVVIIIVMMRKLLVIFYSFMDTGQIPQMDTCFFIMIARYFLHLIFVGELFMGERMCNKQIERKKG